MKLTLANVTWEVRAGHVLDLLRALPDESVHCVVTSPPYWGLRSYSTVPQVWGGERECEHSLEAHKPPKWRSRKNPASYGKHSHIPAGELPGCDHEWGESVRAPWANAVSGPNGDRLNARTKVKQKTAGMFCQKCGAWYGDLGLEPSVSLYIEHMVEVFREVWRVLRRDGTLWLNMGDSYVAGGTGHNSIHAARGTATKMFAKGGRYRLDNIRKDGAKLREWEGLKEKDLCMIPARLVLALQEEGWWLRSKITWCKTAPMPESAKDRPKSATEEIFLLARSKRYFYDIDAVRIPFADNRQGRDSSKRESERNRGGRSDGYTKPNGIDPSTNGGANICNFWVLGPEPFGEAHFATFPSEIPRRAILAGTSAYGCCADCGAPWKRVVHREPTPDHIKAQFEASRVRTQEDHGREDGFTTRKPNYTREVLGESWEPTCKCGCARVEPAVVLDPFNGAGTTVMVALRLGRRGLGLELNSEYVQMSEERIRGDAPLFEGRGFTGVMADERERGNGSVAEAEMLLLPGFGDDIEQLPGTGDVPTQGEGLGALAVLAGE